MAHIYNSQLDAFELYHHLHQDQKSPSSAPSSLGEDALPALGHAVAGAVGAAVANVCTYPLDLIITRLQIQRQLRKGPAEAREDEYKNVQDAARKIYDREGGLAAFYTGLPQDTGKTVSDAFLFFLAYTFLRQRRLSSRIRRAGDVATTLPATDELVIGFVAGSFTKLLTTPISNIVTRKQTAALLKAPSSPGKSSSESAEVSQNPSSTKQIAQEILRQRGILGFWSGYSASLVLTLNPTLTFFLFETFKRLLLPRSRRDNPPPLATFLLAATSKVCASSITYPFSVAKARAQVGSQSESTTPRNGGNIFSSLLAILQSEGPSVLYSGLRLELLKAFLAHGTTMIVKQYAHRFILQAYYVLGWFVKRLRSRGVKVGEQTEQILSRARVQRFEYYDLARARAEDKAREIGDKASGVASTIAGFGSDLASRANETADLVADYVEENDVYQGLDGTGLAKWFEQK